MYYYNKEVAGLVLVSCGLIGKMLAAAIVPMHSLYATPPRNSERWLFFVIVFLSLSTHLHCADSVAR